MSDSSALEAILEPELPIVDPHHHLWDRRHLLAGATGAVQHSFNQVVRLSPRYLFDDLCADLHRGHNIIGTVSIECGAMYRADGPGEMKAVGETEFVNGVAAMSASGLYGAARACAGIVGHADCRLGDMIVPVLEAHIAACGGRFRGVRQGASWDADPLVLGPLARMSQGLYRQPDFRVGFAHLAVLGLSFDAWLLEPQLEDLIDLAASFPDTTIVLDHVGTPLGIASYAGKRTERYPLWLANIRKLAALPNTHVKLGGLAMPFVGFDSFMTSKPSAVLAEDWRPYIEPCIEAFGVDRCMFESNFPVELCGCTYDVLWNAFKRLAAGSSDAEKAALFSNTARRIYRLTI
jgi:predicted TIM-barrel fold metal-dependent hydrolase